MPGRQSILGVVDGTGRSQLPSAFLIVPKGQAGVVGAEHIPELVRYVPGGQGRGVVEISSLLQLPSGCLTVSYGHGGLGLVEGVEQIPGAVKYVPGGQGRGVDGVSITAHPPSACLTKPNGQGG